MSIFNQLIPRLSRSLDRAEANGSSQPEYAVKPAYRISETPEAWSLTVHLPGVTKEGLEVTAEEGVVSIRGKRVWQKPEGWTSLYRESYESPYELSLEHDNTVDADKIQAELKDGVLQVTLPKAEAIKPRKIVVN